MATPIEPARASASADRTPIAGLPLSDLAPPAKPVIEVGSSGPVSRLNGRPTKRPCVRHSLRIGGHKVFIQVDFWPGTRRVFGFFVDLHKEGAPLRSTAAIVAESNNRALQQGASLESVCEALRTAGFEPNGLVTGHETITHATSLFDLVAQVLEDEDEELRAKVAQRRAEREQAEKARFG